MNEHHSHQPRGNGMGVAGFVLSLLGLLTCGLLAPFGVLFSIIGMRREPRGLAIAGLIIGLVAICGWAIPLIFFGTMVFGFIAVAAGLASPEGETEFELQIYASMVEAEKQNSGSYPSSLSHFPESIWDTTDGWGTPYRYTVAPDGASFELVSAGPDMQFGTSDDVRPRQR